MKIVILKEKKVKDNYVADILINDEQKETIKIHDVKSMSLQKVLNHINENVNFEWKEHEPV